MDPKIRHWPQLQTFHLPLHCYGHKSENQKEYFAIISLVIYFLFIDQFRCNNKYYRKMKFFQFVLKRWNFTRKLRFVMRISADEFFKVQYVRVLLRFSNLHNLLSANKNNQFWQIPTFFRLNQSKRWNSDLCKLEKREQKPYILNNKCIWKNDKRCIHHTLGSNRQKQEPKWNDMKMRLQCKVS